MKTTDRAAFCSRWRGLASGLFSLALLAGGLGSARGEKAGERPGTLVTGDFQHKARQPYAGNATGDFNGDGLSDVMTSVPFSFAGPGNTNDLWVGLSDGSGNISLVKSSNVPFAATAYPLVGDYNGDGKDDLLNFYVPPIIGATAPRPHIMQSDGTGHFALIFGPNGTGVEMMQPFADWAASTEGWVRRLACDINGDGRDDVVLTGHPAWTSIPVAFSNGNGSFTVTTNPIAGFADFTEVQSSKLACADFNGDGLDDLIALGGPGWTTIPVAFSLGNGSFTVTNYADSFFPVWATHLHSQLVTSDLNGDGRADLLLTGNSSWSTVRVGLSGGGGTFGMTLSPTYNLHLWAAEPQSLALGGDFNGDGLGDFTLLGGADYWYTLPIGFSNGDSPITFTTYNQPVP